MRLKPLNTVTMVRMVVKEEIKLLWKCRKKWGGGGAGGDPVRDSGCMCKRRIEGGCRSGGGGGGGVRVVVLKLL